MRSIALALTLVLAVAVPGIAEEPCRPRSGAKQKVAVRFSPPEGGMIAGLTVVVDYPERKVSLPGAGTDLPKEIFGGTPTGAVIGGNDFGHELKIVLAAPGELTPGKFVELAFEVCEGSEPAAAADFTCRVVDAADPMANLVRDATCRVTVP